MITFVNMAMRSTIIAVYLHVIPHFNTNELWYKCVSHDYLYEKNMFIRKVKTNLSPLTHFKQLANQIMYTVLLLFISVRLRYDMEVYSNNW